MSCLCVPTLQLLRLHLVRLCKVVGVRVKFLITTRPDAVCGKVEGVLGRLFGSDITFTSPEELRVEDEKKEGVLVYNTVVSECLMPKGAARQSRLPVAERPLGPLHCYAYRF